MTNELYRAERREIYALAYLLLGWEIFGTSHSFWSSRDKLKHVGHSDISAAFESCN
jgi:hypothetical protein